MTSFGISQQTTRLTNRFLHRYEVMYAQFKMMCKMSGIPAPPPELMKAMMAGSVKDAMGDSDDVDPQVKEQMENVMKDFGGDAEGLDEMMKSVSESNSKFDSTPSTRWRARV